jgi:hypothetical protein
MNKNAKYLITWLIKSLMPNSKPANRLYSKAIELIYNGSLASKDAIIKYLYSK